MGGGPTRKLRVLGTMMSWPPDGPAAAAGEASPKITASINRTRVNISPLSYHKSLRSQKGISGTGGIRTGGIIPVIGQKPAKGPGIRTGFPLPHRGPGRGLAPGHRTGAEKAAGGVGGCGGDVGDGNGVRAALQIVRGQNLQGGRGRGAGLDLGRH